MDAFLLFVEWLFSGFRDRAQAGPDRRQVGRRAAKAGSDSEQRSESRLDYADKCALTLFR
jgi:hypothetical protein